MWGRGVGKRSEFDEVIGHGVGQSDVWLEEMDQRCQEANGDAHGNGVLPSCIKSEWGGRSELRCPEEARNSRSTSERLGPDRGTGNR